MKIKINEDNYVEGYCEIGDIENSIEYNSDIPEGFEEKYSFFKYEDEKLVFDSEKYNTVMEESKRKEEYEKEFNKQEEILKQLERKSMLMSLSDEESYSIRYLFEEWKVNTNYKKNEKVKYKNKFYKVLQDHTSQADWTPDTASSLYVEISDPNVEYPEFKQPTGAHDAYNIGDKITFNGKKYISLINGNAWSPEAYPAGWKLVEE